MGLDGMDWMGWDGMIGTVFTASRMYNLTYSGGGSSSSWEYHAADVGM